MTQRMPVRLFLAFIALVAILSVSGCCCCSLCEPGTGRFVFLDRHTDVIAKVVNGTDPFPVPITSVQYSYNESTRKLQLLFPQNFYDHYAGLKVFYGETAMPDRRDGIDFGGRIGYQMISQLPFESNHVKITGVDSDGTVRLSYGNQSLVLSPGQSWSGDTYWTVESTQGRNGTVWLNVTRRDTFTNYGLLDATNISE